MDANTEKPNAEGVKSSYQSVFEVERGLGMLVFLGGLAAAYYFIVHPLMAASRHEVNVSLSLKGVMLSPVAIGVGILYVVKGSRMNSSLNNPKPASPMFLLFIFLLMAGDGYLYYWLKNQLIDYGYQF